MSYTRLKGKWEVRIVRVLVASDEVTVRFQIRIAIVWRESQNQREYFIHTCNANGGVRVTESKMTVCST